MLNFVICDDNLVITQKLEKILTSIFKTNNYDAKILLSTTNPNEILSMPDISKINVLILDIQLKSNLTGLDVAKEFRKKNKNAYLIFSTGHLEYLISAYKYKTFDYLVKPISFERLKETIDRIFDDLYGMPKKYLKIDNKNTVIVESDIEYIKRDGMKLVFHTSSNDYDTYSSFNKIKDTLPNNFIRCHKSFIVNMSNVKEIDSSNNTITFNDNDVSYIGPKYKKDFLEVFNNDRIL